MSVGQRARNPYVVALVIVLLASAAVIAWLRLAPYGMTRGEVQAAVARLGSANAEYFYLGEEVNGLQLATVDVDEADGRMFFEYGRCMDHDEGGCNRPLNVISTPRSELRSDEEQDLGCARIRQVLGEGQIVVVDSSEVEITYWYTIPDGYMTDFARSKALVPQLRKVGQAGHSFCVEQTP